MYHLEVGGFQPPHTHSLEESLTFSVSRSFTVGRGVRVDMVVPLSAACDVGSGRV